MIKNTPNTVFPIPLAPWSLTFALSMASLDSSPKITIGNEAPNPKIAIMIATLIKEHPLLENKINNIFSLNEKSQLHILTHQRLHIKFWKIEINGVLQNGIDIEKLKTYPFPIVLFNFIENHFKN